MKITRKIGLSHYTLELNAEETAKWRAIDAMDCGKYQKRKPREEIALSAFLRINFGGEENAIKAVKALEPSLNALEKVIK